MVVKHTARWRPCEMRRGREDKEERLPQASSFLLQWGEGFISDEMVTLGHN